MTVGAWTSFDATGSTDNSGITSYNWDFGDGNTTTGTTPSHTYADPGTYTVTLTVADSAGNTDTDTLTATVTDTTAPTAEAGPNQIVDEDTATSFDGTGSTDNGDLTYSWDFGDGNTTTGATPNHTYITPGSYTVTLTVTDGGANTDTDTLTVTVNDTTAPTAETSGNMTTDEDTSVSFDANNSTDNVGITSYSWDFGDGTTATGATPSHTYVDPGTYNASVTVSDAAGNTNTSSVTVTVNDTTTPTATAGPNQSVETNENVTFDATNSTDNDAIASYDWTFGDNTTASGATPTHTYSESGTYTVTLTVTDASGHEATDSLTVDVSEPTTSSGGSQAWPPSTSTESETTPDDQMEVVVNRTDDRNRTATGTDARINATVTNADPNSTVVLDFRGAGNETDAGTGDNDTENGSDLTPSADLNNISVSGMEMNITRGGDFTINVTSQSRTLQTDGFQSVESMSSADRKFATETGARPAGRVVVEHTISDADIDNVTFTFQVRKSYLHTVGGDPESVTLFRNETTQWRTLDTNQIDETDTHYVFRAKSPGLSEFTVGVSSPLFTLRDATLDDTRASPGDQVTVSAVVSNDGAVDGTYNITATVNGEPARTKAVSVPARTNQTVTVPVTIDEAGTYDVAINGEPAGILQVVSRETTAEPSTSEPTTTTDDSNPIGSFGPVLLVIGVVLAVVVVLWRRRTDDT